MIHVPGTAHIQSSIAAPTDVSRRDIAPYEGMAQRFNPSADPLNDSLGPYLASCALVFLVVLAVLYVLWGVHRRVSMRITHARAADPVPAPGTTIPLWTAPATPALLGVPNIHLTAPTPRATAALHVSPSLTTSRAPRRAKAAGTLEVPTLKQVSQARKAAKAEAKAAAKLQAKLGSVSNVAAKPRTPVKKGKLPPGPADKPKKAKVFAGKENQTPQVNSRVNPKQKRMKRVLETFKGTNEDTWMWLP